MNNQSTPPEGRHPTRNFSIGAEQLPAELAHALRQAAPKTVRRIATEIQQQVTVYAGPEDGQRHQIVLATVDAAVDYFLEAIESSPAHESVIFTLIRELSEAEAIEGYSIDALRAAHHVATRVAWQDMRQVAEELGLDHITVSTLVDLMFTFVEELIEQVAQTHEQVVTNNQTAAQVARRHILTGMLTGRSLTQYADDLVAAKWHPPAEIIVVTATFHDDTHIADAPPLRPDVLSGASQRLMTAIAEPRIARAVARRLSEAAEIDKVAISWVMPLPEARDAHRWTRRALDLADRGLVDGTEIIDCAQHHQLLLLYADPALSRHASDELLAPLARERPFQRLNHAETLLAWLQARESAPALGKRLGVHPNTVRGHLRRLRRLFGDQLDDPQQTLALLSALEVAVPVWREQVKPPDLRQEGVSPTP